MIFAPEPRLVILRADNTQKEDGHEETTHCSRQISACGRRLMFKAGTKALFVFLSMAFLAAQAGTGFMRELFAGDVYPRALRAFDWILQIVFTGPLGRTGGVVALLALGSIFAALIIRREMKGNEPAERTYSSEKRGQVVQKPAKAELAQALIAAGMKDLFKLKDCRVVEVN